MSVKSIVQERDLDSIFHPMSDMSALHKDGPLMIVRGEGVHVYDENDNQYIDGLSGLWCTSLGYANEEIAETAYEQIKTLSYAHLFLDKGSEISVKLAEKLKKMVPGNFSKVFFGLSGSDANDTQIKLIRYYNNVIGRPEKKKIIGRVKGYHGIAGAAASATGGEAYHRGFDLPVQGFYHTDCPHYYRNSEKGETEDQFTTRLAANLESLILKEGADTVAAFIAEPIMGAGGVIVPPDSYFEKIQKVLKKYEVLFVDDEVVCGFGRTGNPFGSDTFDIQPDTVTLAKALTSADAPLSAIMIPEFIHEAILENSQKWGMFGHGFTYSGHPLSVAVGLKVLEIYERDNVFVEAARKGQQFQKALNTFKNHPLVGEVRGKGMIGACELVANKVKGTPFNVDSAVGKYCLARMRKHGLIARAIGDALCLCPPLVSSEDEIGEIFTRYGKALDETLEWVSKNNLLVA